MSFQKLILCGELTLDPELRYTQSGKACCALRLKTVDAWPGRDGQIHEEAEIHKLIVWGPDGERAAKEYKKGDAFLVEGRNKTRKWMAENGLEVDITEVIVVPGGMKPLGGRVPAQAAAPKEKKSSPVKPLPPKPDKVPVDLAEVAVAEDLPF